MFALIDGILDVRPRIARLTLEGDSAAWTFVGPRSNGSFDLGSMDPEQRDLLQWGESQLRSRQAARRERNFAESDRLRGVLEDRGFVVKDAPGRAVLERYF